MLSSSPQDKFHDDYNYPVLLTRKESIYIEWEREKFSSVISIQTFWFSSVNEPRIEFMISNHET